MKRSSFLLSSALLGLGTMVPYKGFVRDLIKKEDQSQYSEEFLNTSLNDLIDRGVPSTYYKSKVELNYIGMPVGGAFCGTVYLGGDGRLWLWDIFQNYVKGSGYPNSAPWPYFSGNYVDATNGANYVNPFQNTNPSYRPLDQGIIFNITYQGLTVSKQMIAAHWDEISFKASYPIATVTYTSNSIPITVIAQVFSPFIPLDIVNSSLPLTVYSIQVINNGGDPMSVQVVGFIENKAAIKSAAQGTNLRVNTLIGGGNNNYVGVIGTCTDLNKQVPTNISSNGDFGDFSVITTQVSNAVYIPNFTYSDTTNNAINYVPNITTYSTDINTSLKGAVAITYNILPGATQMYTIAFAWYFPNLPALNNGSSIMPITTDGNKRFYSTKFASSNSVVAYFADQIDYLINTTKSWYNTYYNQSTLPYWFLERCFSNISVLATNTCFQLSSGRYYFFEGANLGSGTVTHVWVYAFGLARLFPQVEQYLREVIDFGRYQLTSGPQIGGIAYRGEYSEGWPNTTNTYIALDGQSGVVLRSYIAHTMSADSSFLSRNYTKIKLATQYIISLAKDGDGLINTEGLNTLDAFWTGKVSWIAGLGIAAVWAAQKMAQEMNDTAFAQTCSDFVKLGSQNMDKYLYNNYYYFHLPDPVSGKSQLGAYNTCLIDQIFGASYAWQAGLGEFLDPNKVNTALINLFNFNFRSDVAVYLANNPIAPFGGLSRPYALPGEGGLFIDTNALNDTTPYGTNGSYYTFGYFSETMTGFEHEVAAHMLAEGLVLQGLTVTSAIHQRYHASKRNPFNEIEFGDHYGRSMASYGSFVSMTGFVYHGPKMNIGFYPKITPENFSAAYIVANGFGYFTHVLNNSANSSTLTISLNQVNGSLSLMSFQVPLAIINGFALNDISLYLNDALLAPPTTLTNDTTWQYITFSNIVNIYQGNIFKIVISNNNEVVTKDTMNISVYPNPATTTINIQFVNNINAQYMVASFYNMLGTAIQIDQKKFALSDGNNVISINVSNLQIGEYSVKMLFDDAQNTTYSSLFIKQ